MYQLPIKISNVNQSNLMTLVIAANYLNIVSLKRLTYSLTTYILTNQPKLLNITLLTETLPPDALFEIQTWLPPTTTILYKESQELKEHQHVRSLQRFFKNMELPNPQFSQLLNDLQTSDVDKIVCTDNECDVHQIINISTYKVVTGLPNIQLQYKNPAYARFEIYLTMLNSLLDDS